MKTIEQRTQDKYNLEQQLENFCQWVDSVVPEDIEFPKWSVPSGSVYTDHYINESCIYIMLVSYDVDDSQYDEHTTCKFPLEWLDNVHEDTDYSYEDQLVDIITEEYLKYNKEELDNEINSVKLRAIELGLIEE